MNANSGWHRSYAIINPISQTTTIQKCLRTTMHNADDDDSISIHPSHSVRSGIHRYHFGDHSKAHSSVVVLILVVVVNSFGRAANKSLNRWTRWSGVVFAKNWICQFEFMGPRQREDCEQTAPRSQFNDSINHLAPTQPLRILYSRGNWSFWFDFNYLIKLSGWKKSPR